jgi:hypothetical protein
MAARMVVAMVDKFDLTPVPVSRDYCYGCDIFTMAQSQRPFGSIELG